MEGIKLKIKSLFLCETETQLRQTTGNWEEHWDEKGRTYYINKRTDEISWDIEEDEDLPLSYETIETINVGDVVYCTEDTNIESYYVYTAKKVRGLINKQYFTRIIIHPQIKLYRCISEVGGFLREYVDISKKKILLVGDRIMRKDNLRKGQIIQKSNVDKTQTNVYRVRYDNNNNTIEDAKEDSIISCPLKVVPKNEVVSVIGHAGTDKNRLYVLTKDGHKGFVSLVSKEPKSKDYPIFKELEEIQIEPVNNTYTCVHRSIMRDGVKTGINQTESKKLTEIELNDEVIVLGRAQEYPNRFFVRHERTGFEGFISKVIALTGNPNEIDACIDHTREADSWDNKNFLNAIQSKQAFITKTTKENNTDDIRFNPLPRIENNMLIDGSAKIGSKYGLKTSLSVDPVKLNKMKKKWRKEDTYTNKEKELNEIINNLSSEPVNKKVGNYLKDLVDYGSYFINTHSSILSNCFKTKIPIIVQGTVGRSTSWDNSQILFNLGKKIFNLDQNDISSPLYEGYSKLHLPGSIVNNMSINFYQEVTPGVQNGVGPFEDDFDINRLYLYKKLNQIGTIDDFIKRYYKPWEYRSNNNDVFFHKGSGLFPLNIAKEYIYGLNSYDSDGGANPHNISVPGRFATRPTVQYTEDDIKKKFKNIQYSQEIFGVPKGFKASDKEIKLYKEQEKYKKLWSDGNLIHPTLYNNVVSNKISLQSLCDYLELIDFKGVLIIAGCRNLKEEEHDNLARVTSSNNQSENDSIKEKSVTFKDTLGVSNTIKISQIFEDYGNTILSLSESANKRYIQTYKKLMEDHLKYYHIGAGYECNHYDDIGCKKAKTIRCDSILRRGGYQSNTKSIKKIKYRNSKKNKKNILNKKSKKK